MKASEIAIVCYAVNNAYRAVMGDLTRICWEDLLPEDQESLIAGVQMAIDNEVTPEEQHNHWLEDKIASGWTFGEKEDLEAKKNPNLVPYPEVPLMQRVKDALFFTIVKSMKNIVTEDAKAPLVIQVGKISVKYIGKRPDYIDGTYGTGIHWKQGETQMVPEEAAIKLLKHVDQYVLGEVEEETSQEVPHDPDAPEDPDDPENKENTDEAIQMAKDAVNQMRSKQAVVDWVEVNFQGMKLDVNEKLAPLKQKATGFIDQYGLN